MLAILFPHLFEDLEYLVPSEEEQPVADPPTAGYASRNVINAVAGPSRLS